MSASGDATDTNSLPVRHMVENEEGMFIGIALMSAEGFSQFLRDHNIEQVVLKLVTSEDKYAQQLPPPYRAPLRPHEIPYFTMEYRDYFISLFELS